jgi:Ca-activated chloride channel family protein
VATGDHPIAASIEAAAAPWNPSHRLVRVGVRAKEVQMGHRPSNLVFLVDVSGSMNAEDRLPLLQRGMRMLVDRLSESDTVSIVTYAGAAGVRLQPTNGAKKEEIARVIDDLSASGSTNGSAGIQTAYDLAVANFIRDGVNRVILMTDGDFNVGTTSMDALVKLIEYRAQSGVFLSVLGVGRGNLKDATMEKLADRGNGNYAYIDTLNEARKVLVEQMAGTLITVAKDVKLQVEFNPTQVKAYRLLGYENRVLAAADFANDRKDAGDMGAGHTVTAFFELVPHGAEVDTAGGDPLRFQRVADQSRLVVNGDTEKESLALRLRYKLPDGSTSRLMELPFVDTGKTFDRASSDFRFAAAVASFGMILRDSPFKGASTLDDVVAIARNSRGADRSGYREEFVNLAERARQIRRSPVLE